MRPAKVLHKAEIAKCPGGWVRVPTRGGGEHRWWTGEGMGESGNYAPEGVHLRP